MEPVSLEEHPDYEDFVFKPMDLVKLEHVSTKDYNPILDDLLHLTISPSALQRVVD